MVFEALDRKDRTHEQVIFCSNRQTGLKAIIAIHNTRLGPALGGCRMYPYGTEDQALEDVLRLSRAMSYKAAMSGLSFGGGKSVIIADPEKQKTPELLRSFGAHIESLKGRYIVAKDMGVTKEDLMYIGEKSSYVLGRPVTRGGVGDPSRSTAKGVYYGIKEAVRWKLKKRSLKGVRVLVQGLGAVGRNLVEFLSQDQADIFVFDIKPSCMKAVQAQFPQVKTISKEEVFNFTCEVFSPCSVGAVINEESIKKLKCLIIAGGANNQLSSSSIGKKLMEKDILYIPDFVINSGGLIYVSSCISPEKSREWIERKIQEIPQTIRGILKSCREESIEPFQMALNIAKNKIQNSSVQPEQLRIQARSSISLV